MSRRQPRSSRAATFLLLLGCVGVLGTTFGLGMVAGRSWPRLLPSLGPPAARDHGALRRPGEGRPGERKPPEPTPVLTFYEELTAPLAAPPPAAPKPAPRPASRPAPEPERSGAAPAVPPPAAPGARRYTVQVGAFAARAQADALRARLAAAGWDAYVAEAEGAGARWRVRVGSYASREEARQAARRLQAERQISGYVTLR